MTHDDIFHRACKDLRNSTSTRMLTTAKRYFELFERKCLDDGVNPQLVMAYSKVGKIFYEKRKLQLK